MLVQRRYRRNRLGRLRTLGSSFPYNYATDYAIGLINPAVGATSMALDLFGCSWSDLFSGNCGWKVGTAAMSPLNTMQINSVPANAETYYGPTSTTAQVAQQAAADQIAQQQADQASISQYPGSNWWDVVTNPSGTSLASSIPPWLWIVGGVVGGVLLIKAVR